MRAGCVWGNQSAETCAGSGNSIDSPGLLQLAAAVEIGQIRRREVQLEIGAVALEIVIVGDICGGSGKRRGKKREKEGGRDQFAEVPQIHPQKTPS